MAGSSVDPESQQKNRGGGDLPAEAAATEERLQQADKEIAALNAIAATVSGSLDLKELLQGTLIQVLEVLQLPAGWIFLHDGAQDYLTLSAQQGLSPAFALEEETLPLGSCACKEVLRTGQAGE